MRQSFSHEQQVLIRYLHENGLSDTEILKRVWDSFADRLVAISRFSEERQKEALAGKVAVYTSRWADVEAPESEVSKFAWGAALIEEMARSRNRGNGTGAVEKLIDV